MWPMLLNMTRDDCRRTLRRLELEAYSNMISVFRAQGALEDSRKKLLEELRAVLRISHDRHSAEARRAANDELLATVAEQLSGPNTGLEWLREGRRRVPLMPRGYPQTVFTEFADKVAEALKSENRELKKRKEAEKLAAAKTSEVEEGMTQSEIADNVTDSKEPVEEFVLATEDMAVKMWEEELTKSRKRKVTESTSVSDDATTPVKSSRNIPANTNQKHLNLAQLYSKFSQPSTSKPSGQSKHSYNQVSKVSTNKSRSNQGKHSRTPKQRNTVQVLTPASQAKKSHHDILGSPTKYNADYSGQPNTFQSTYAQSVLGQRGFEDSKVLGGDSSSLQLAHEASTIESRDDPIQSHLTPRSTLSGKPNQLVIKKKGEIVTEKKSPSDIKLVQKPAEGIKLFSNRPVVVTPGSTHKPLHTPGKFVTTKVLGPVAKHLNSPNIGDKMIVVSKPVDNKSFTNSKMMMSTTGTPTSHLVSTNISPKLAETITPKGIPATDLKVSAKTFLLNPKPGQKMVVVPAKGRTKTGPDGQQMPLIQLKGMSTPMRLVPVTTQTGTPIKSSTVTVMSQGAQLATAPKVVSVEPIKTANMADIVPVKGLTPVSATKPANAIVRPSSTKGSVIVVQKSATLGKAISFTKNGNDMSKIIMGKNISQLIQAKPEEVAKGAGNVILLDLNNDQSSRATTMSEILESRVPSRQDDRKGLKITEDTPVLFDTQLSDDTCNPSSMDSTTGSIGDMVPLESIQSIPVDKHSGKGDGKDPSNVTDWEMELDTVSRKDKDEDDKLNSLHLDLGMSSDSDNDFMDGRKSKSKHSSQESIARTATPSGDSRETFSRSSGLSLATRTLLSQLQDEGSSSNDSSFALKSKTKDTDHKDHTLNKSESDALSKAKEKLTEKVAKSQQKRIDIFSTAITTADINLDSFSYLEEGMLCEEELGRRALTPDTASSDSVAAAEPVSRH